MHIVIGTSNKLLIEECKFRIVHNIFPLYKLLVTIQNNMYNGTIPNPENYFFFIVQNAVYLQSVFTSYIISKFDESLLTAPRKNNT